MSFQACVLFVVAGKIDGGHRATLFQGREPGLRACHHERDKGDSYKGDSYKGDPDDTDAHHVAQTCTAEGES